MGCARAAVLWQALPPSALRFALGLKAVNAALDALRPCDSSTAPPSPTDMQ
jgi:hypothetical protein